MVCFQDNPENARLDNGIVTLGANLEIPSDRPLRITIADMYLNSQHYFSGL